MPTCFVSMQFGSKTMPDGKVLDYDFLYREIIRPALEEISFECHRLDDLMTGGSIWHKTLFQWVMSSDVMIADITSGNANVFYELGMRHAVREFTTVVICEEGIGGLPFDVSNGQCLCASHHEIKTMQARYRRHSMKISGG